jgi:hypothetical protein
MIKIEVIDTNGKVISENGQQIFNNTLIARMYAIYDKPIIKSTWTFDGDVIRIIEGKPNFYNTEHRFFTKKTGDKQIQLDIVYSNGDTDSATLNFTLINLPT